MKEHAAQATFSVNIVKVIKAHRLEVKPSARGKYILIKLDF
jgi:hypothetical protein